MTEGYIIDYNTGIMDYAETLDEAKAKAEAGMAYTQESIFIRDYETGDIITRSRWWGVVPESEYETDVMCQFGDFGYYEKWDDEL